MGILRSRFWGYQEVRRLTAWPPLRATGRSRGVAGNHQGRYQPAGYKIQAVKLEGYKAGGDNGFRLRDRMQDTGWRKTLTA